METDATPSIDAARQQVSDATAMIASMGSVGEATAFAVHYQGRDFLVTSAHETNSYVQGSYGFQYRGKSYFLIAKDGHLAVAEQLAFNPQGAPCTARVTFNSAKPFTDLSILRVLGPQDSFDVIQAVATDPANGPRQQFVLHSTEVAQAMFSGSVFGGGRLDEEKLRQLTKDFKLKPLAVGDTAPAPAVGEPGYAVGYVYDEAARVEGQITSVSPQIPALNFDFTPQHPVREGDSGSLLYTVGTHGEVLPAGVVTGLIGCSQIATAVRFSEVLAGMRAVTEQPTLPHADMEKACHAPAASVWYSPENITPSSEPVPLVRNQHMPTCFLTQR